MDTPVAAYQEAFSMPSCCIEFLQGLRDAGLTDPTWAFGRNCVGNEDAAEELELDGQFQTNFLLDCRGFRVLPFTPCSISCQKSVTLAD